uniref:Thioredoxin domain-containing protein n=1 Tax=Plectus sambesii TaxID=2011161 RepID=A0A914UNK5_9BILA
MLFVLYAVLFLIVGCSARRQNCGSVHRRHGRSLYDSTTKTIQQLDRYTFADTVYNADSATIVQFYTDWCGHSRRLVPEWKKFSELAHNECSDVVKVAVVNCVDLTDRLVCKANNIPGYPTIKYFPRHSKGPNDGIMMIRGSAPYMREQLLDFLMSDSVECSSSKLKIENELTDYLQGKTTKSPDYPRERTPKSKDSPQERDIPESRTNSAPATGIARQGAKYQASFAVFCSISSLIIAVFSVSHL